MLKIPFMTKQKETDENFRAIQGWATNFSARVEAFMAQFTDANGNTIIPEDAIIEAPLDLSNTTNTPSWFVVSDPEGAPSTVDNLKASAGIGMVIVSWDLQPEANFRTYEVWESTNENDPGEIVATSEQQVVTIDHPGEADVTYWYRVRAINTRDEAGEFAGPVSATLPLVYTENMAQSAINDFLAASSAEFIADLESGQTVLKGDYITTGTIGANVGYLGTVYANKVIGGAGTFDSALIGSLTANKITSWDLVSNNATFGNAVINNANVGTATINGARIASLDAGKITTGTLDAARIATGSLSADKITAGTFDGFVFATSSQDGYKAWMRAGSLPVTGSPDHVGLVLRGNNLDYTFVVDPSTKKLQINGYDGSVGDGYSPLFAINIPQENNYSGVHAFSSVNFAADETKTLSVSFPSGRFTSTPVVVATPYTTEPKNWSVGVASISTTGCTLYVHSVGTRNGSSLQIGVDARYGGTDG